MNPVKYHQNCNRHWSVSPHNNNKNPVKYLLCVEFTEKSSDAIFFKKLKQKKKTWKNKKMFYLVDYSCSSPYTCLKGNGFIPNLSKVFLNHIETTEENISKSLTGWYHDWCYSHITAALKATQMRNLMTCCSLIILTKWLMPAYMLFFSRHLYYLSYLA